MARCDELAGSPRCPRASCVPTSPRSTGGTMPWPRVGCAEAGLEGRMPPAISADAWVPRPGPLPWSSPPTWTPCPTPGAMTGSWACCRDRDRPPAGTARESAAPSRWRSWPSPMKRAPGSAPPCLAPAPWPAPGTRPGGRPRTPRARPSAGLPGLRAGPRKIQDAARARKTWSATWKPISNRAPIWKPRRPLGGQRDRRSPTVQAPPGGRSPPRRGDTL